MTAFEPPYPAAIERFPTLRQSLLSSFDECGLSTYFEQDSRKGWSHPWQARGQMFHRFAGEALRVMQAQGEEEIPVGEALEILRDLLAQDWADRACRRCGGALEPGVDAAGQRECACGHRQETELLNLPSSEVKDLHWCVVKWAHDNTFTISDLVDVERRLDAEIAYPDRANGGWVRRKLTGQLDALFAEGTQRAIVLDWKDMWKLPGAQEVGFGGWFQQRFYAWLIFHNYPTVEEVTLREFYIRYSQPREATVTRVDMEQIEAELAALTERFDRAWNEQIELERAGVEKRAFVPTPGKHCSFCARPMACPIPVPMREEGRITDEVQAARVARQLIVGEEVVSRSRKHLRAWAATHGPVPVADAKGKRAYGYVEDVKTTRPTPEMLDALQLELGRPPTVAEVKGLYKTTVGTRFKTFVPEDVDESAQEAEIQAQLEASIAAAQARFRPGVDAPAQPDNVVELRPKKPSGAGRNVPQTDQGA